MKTKFKEIIYSQLKEKDAAFSNFTYNGKQYIDIIEILNHKNGVLNANIGVYIGDCHTTSKIAAAMSYISYQVLAAGRTKTKPVELTKSKEEKIKANLELLNKVGKLLRMDGEY